MLLDDVSNKYIRAIIVLDTRNEVVSLLVAKCLRPQKMYRGTRNRGEIFPPQFMSSIKNPKESLFIVYSTLQTLSLLFKHSLSSMKKRIFQK